MNEKREGYNPLPDKELKERMDFMRMFERQEEQIKQTPHIQNLLIAEEDRKRPKNQQDLRAKINDLEAVLLYKIDQLKRPRRLKLDININNKRHAYFIGAVALSTAVLFALLVKPETKVEFKEKIIYQKAPSKTKQQYFMTKYVNIRTDSKTSAKKLTTLPPNSVVEVLGEQKNWKRVKYLDHIKNKSIIGWAYSEHLRPVK